MARKKKAPIEKKITTEAQRQAAALAVASGKRIDEIAKVADVSVRTVHRWLNNAEFQRMIREYESGSRNEAPEVVTALVESHQERMLAVSQLRSRDSEHRKRLRGSEAEWYDTIDRVGFAQTFKDSSAVLMARLIDQSLTPEPTQRFMQIVMELAEEYVSR